LTKDINDGAVISGKTSGGITS